MLPGFRRIAYHTGRFRRVAVVFAPAVEPALRDFRLFTAASRVVHPVSPCGKRKNGIFFLIFPSQSTKRQIGVLIRAIQTVVCRSYGVNYWPFVRNASYA